MIILFVHGHRWQLASKLSLILVGDSNHLTTFTLDYLAFLDEVLFLTTERNLVYRYVCNCDYDRGLSLFTCSALS